MTRRHAFLTPDSLEGAPVCYPLAIPEHLYIYLQGALLPLSLEHNWEEHGEVTPDEAAQYWLGKLEELERGTCGMFPSFSAYLKTQQSIEHNTVTELQDFEVEQNDAPGEIYTWSTANHELEILQSGLYAVTFQTRWAGATGSWFRRAFVNREGIAFCANEHFARASNLGFLPGGITARIPANSTMEFMVFHQQGGDVIVQSTNNQTRWSFTRISE